MPCHVVSTSQSFIDLASPSTAHGAGSWKLPPHRALSLRPRAPGVLEIASGRAWVTLRGEGRATPVDHVLQAGDRLGVLPGQHAVVEVWLSSGASSASDTGAAQEFAFRWDVAPAASGRVHTGLACGDGAAAVSLCWDRAVAQPLRDLGDAMVQGGRAVVHAARSIAGAVVRLVWGLARFGVHRVAGALPRRWA